MAIQLEPGWLKRQMNATVVEIKTWPEWMQKVVAEDYSPRRESQMSVDSVDAVEGRVGISNADEYMARQRADPEQCKRFGSAMARLELGQLLYDAGEQQGLTVAQMATQLGVKPEYLEGLVQGEGNPRIGQVGAWMAALGYRFKITIEPMEKKGVA